MTSAEEIDVLRNPKHAAERALKSKRLLRILATLTERGWLDYDPFLPSAELTQEGRAALASLET